MSLSDDDKNLTYRITITRNTIYHQRPRKRNPVWFVKETTAVSKNITLLVNILKICLCLLPNIETRRLVNTRQH